MRARSRRGKPIKVGSKPDAIAITPDGRTAYVANFGSGTVSQVTIATSKVSRSLKAGRHPRRRRKQPGQLSIVRP